MVAGQEKLLKPDAAIFCLLCERNGLDPAECLFIDDSAANVAGARAFGMGSIRYRGLADDDVRAIPDADLPVYTVLLPVYGEPEIVATG